MKSRQAYTPLLVVITGPTASGKTSLAVELASHFNCKILSADSRQFYKGMSIGSAAPTETELKKIRHYFIGHLNVDDEYNVSKFETNANALLEEIFINESIAILVGGSGLYIDAVCKGIDELPDTPPDLRKSLQEEFKTKGIESLRHKLKLLDPEYYAAVDLKNPNRIIRALEVCLTSGQPYSSFRKNKNNSRPYKIVKIAIETDRSELHEIINSRTDKMLINGLINEVKALLPHRNCNALNTVGYKEIIAFLDGDITLEKATEQIKTNTRRYARRQITWLKRYHDIHWFRLSETEKIIRLIQDTINDLQKENH